jgi:hypothetical protein
MHSYEFAFSSYVTEKMMSSNGVDAPKTGRRRIEVSRWAIRLLIALILSVIIIFLFSHSGAVSH